MVFGGEHRDGRLVGENGTVRKSVGREEGGGGDLSHVGVAAPKVRDLSDARQMSLLSGSLRAFSFSDE